MSLIPQHRLFRLLCTDLQSPAVWKLLHCTRKPGLAHSTLPHPSWGLTDFPVSAIELQHWISASKQVLEGMREERRAGLVGQVLSKDARVEDFASRSRHGEAHAVWS